MQSVSSRSGPDDTPSERFPLRAPVTVLLQHEEKASVSRGMQGSCYLDPEFLQAQLFVTTTGLKIFIIISPVNYSVSQTYSQNHMKKMPYY